MSNNHVIELNGNKYNALTGKMIAGPSTPRRDTPNATNHASNSLRQQPSSQLRHRTAPATGASHVSSVHQKPAKSHTLMRSAVKKPAANPIHTVTAHRPRHASPTVPKHKSIVSPASIGSINPHRVARAQHVAKSSLVSKFGNGSAKTVRVAEVPVKPAPSHHAQPQLSPTHAKHASTAMRSRDPFEEALKNAASHEQPKHRKQALHHRIARKLHIKPRTFLLGTGGLTLLVVGSFIAYTRVPTVALKVAATKAGINATLPSYQPAGFSLQGPIATAPGEVSLNYKSNSDNRDFTVTQKTSSWNSETLLGDLATAGKQASYQTFQSSGRTIYIYDGGNATWVDGGIQYKIEGKSSLNSDQLLRIANSL